MKTTALLTIACLISLAAQASAAPCAGPFSYSLPMVPGLNFIANQVNCGANTLPDIMPVVPDGTTVSVFNNVTKAFDMATYIEDLGWDIPLALNPGQGAFLSAPEAFLLTFAGAANVPVLPVPLAPGSCYILSRQLNGVGTYDNIVGAPPAIGTQLHQWNPATQAYETFNYCGGGWSPAVPMMDVGEPVSICTPYSYTLPMVPGFNFIANQLNCGANTLPEIMPVVPEDTTVSIFNNVTKAFDSASYIGDGLGWDVALSLNPGQGAFLYTPVAFLLTLSGSPKVPVLPVVVPAGSCCILSRQINSSALYDDIVGLPPVDGTVLRQWNPATQAYEDYTFELGAWTPAAPMMDIGEPAAICACGSKPALTLAIAEGIVTITWAGPAIYCLQSTPSLTPPVVWTTISGSSPIMVPAGAGTTFFRLKCPCS